jgi:protein-S-isoprenylcysteine O-methyltransferase Ste14
MFALIGLLIHTKEHMMEYKSTRPIHRCELHEEHNPIFFFSQIAFLLIPFYDSTNIVGLQFLSFIGGFLFISGIILGISAIVELWGPGMENKLVITGVYKYLRHPMYYGAILIILGYPLFFLKLLSFFVSFVYVAVLLYWRHMEEISLPKKFKRYKEYKKKTWF